MAFRRKGKNDRKRKQAWHEWIETNLSRLKGIGLPPEVYLDLQHWEDFLANGHLHWHPETSTGFHFSDLSISQMRALLTLLETEDEFIPENFPLPQWLRVRLSQVSERHFEEH
jgi:hypothetical protein